MIHATLRSALLAAMSALLAACTTPTPKPVLRLPLADHAPALDVTARARPIYPGLDVVYALGGTTVLYATLSNTGNIVELDIERSSGHRELDDAALAAVRQWHFVPGSRNGHRIGGVVRVPIHFDPTPVAKLAFRNALWPAAYAHPDYVSDPTPIAFPTVDDAQHEVAARAHQPITGIPQIRQFQIHDTEGKLIQWWIFTDLGTPNAMATRLIFRGTPNDSVITVSSLCTHPGVCTVRKAITLHGPIFARSP